MIPLTTEFLFLYILMIHFLADFVLQTDSQAKLKSSNVNALYCHTFTYSLVWWMASSLILGIFDGTIFAFITFATHTFIDFITSRIGKSYWEKGDYHNGFVVVGADQVLHYLQLYYTFKLLLL